MNIRILFFRTFTAGITAFAVPVFSQGTQYPFQNPELSIEERVANVISLLNQTEKVQLLASSDQTVSRLGFTTTSQTEGYHGAALGGPAGWGGNSSPTTQFCQAYGMGETWDPEVIEKAMDIEATEFRYTLHHGLKSGLIVRAPNCDLGRDPRWGRTEECFGEDPYLVGSITQAVVRGLQGNDPQYLKCASLMKHFLANSNENIRTSANSIFDQRLFREYYSMPFRMGAEAGSECMMAAYNKVNGIPCAVLPALKSVGRTDFGMNGVHCTDGGALGMLVTAHHFFPDTPTAAAACIKAGISQFLDPYTNGVNNALSSNLLTLAEIDSVLKYNFTLWFRLGLLDPPAQVPYTNVGTIAPWTTDSHKNYCRLVTQKSIVLLKNSGNLLPLNRTAVRSIAVIGENADSVCLDWYSGTPPYKVSVLAGIKAKAGSGVTINYARTNAGSAAVNAASSSDVALVVVGNHPLCNNSGWGNCPERSEGKEQRDRDSITFEPLDENLIRDVYAANPNTIVLVLSSFPYAANWAQANVPAILHMTHNSQELGNALADALFGDYNPGGKTTQTWPASIKDLPVMSDYNIRNGRTYMYFSAAPLYAFGYGLSYTTFGYANLLSSSASFDARVGVAISAEISNTGNVAGEEVVQMYVRHLNSTVDRPQKELRGFRRIALGPGETKTVTMALPGRYLAYWDSTKATWFIENDNIEVQVGASSADIRLRDTLAVVNGGPVDMASVEIPYSSHPGAMRSIPVLSGARMMKKGASTILFVRMTRSAAIDMRVYSLTGKLLFRLSRMNLAAGEHCINLPIASAAGVYLIAGKVGEGFFTSKCCVR
jgi:beta-glucosidase